MNIKGKNVSKHAQVIWCCHFFSFVELFPILAHQKRFLERKHKKKRSSRKGGRDEDSGKDQWGGSERKESKEQEDRGKSEGATPSTNEALPQKVTSLIDSFKERKKKTNTWNLVMMIFHCPSLICSHKFQSYCRDRGFLCVLFVICVLQGCNKVLYWKN